MTARAPGFGGSLFAWGKGSRVSTLFVALLLFSFAAHAVAFFVFTVVYPARVTIPAPAPQVTLLSASNPEHYALLRWIEAEDPALVVNAAPVLLPKLFELRYRPSFEMVRTHPRAVPEPEATVEFPAARPPLEMIEGAVSKPPPAIPPRRATATLLHLSASLAPRASSSSTALPINRRSTAPLDASHFLVGLNERGEVRHAFIQKSSGDREMDAEAAHALSRAAFLPAPNPMMWGFARIEWGDDAYLPQPEP